MNSRLLATLLVSCLGTLGLPGIAVAADSAGTSAFRWDSGAVLATDRMFRGQRQTADKPAISGEVKLSHTSGVYAGVWGGNLDLGPGTDTTVELDWFVGWAKRFGQLSVNTGYLYRQRPSSTMSLDFQEVTASIAYDFGVVRPGLGVYHAPDYFQGGRSTYTYANLRVPLGTVHGMKLLATATAGHQDFSNRAIGNFNDMDLRLIATRGAWDWSVGWSDSSIDPATSRLLTRDKAGPRWRAQVLVMF